MEIVIIDENHITTDGVKLEAQEAENYCQGCYLIGPSSTDCVKIKCMKFERADNRNVIYKPQK